MVSNWQTTSLNKNIIFSFEFAMGNLLYWTNFPCNFNYKNSTLRTLAIVAILCFEYSMMPWIHFHPFRKNYVNFRIFKDENIVVFQNYANFLWSKPRDLIPSYITDEDHLFSLSMRSPIYLKSLKRKWNLGKRIWNT